MPEIEQLLCQFASDERQVRFSFDYRDSGYMACAMLTLPTGHLIARTASPVPDHHAAIDQVVASLAAEIERRHMRFQSDGGQDQERRRQRDFAGAAPHLSAMRDENDREGFSDVLRPLLRGLNNNAYSNFAQDPPAGPGAAGAADFQQVELWLDRAWDRWRERPHDQSLERWLVSVLPDVGRAVRR